MAVAAHQIARGLVVTCALVSATGCRRRTLAPRPVLVDLQPRLAHATHQAVPCSQCHPAGARDVDPRQAHATCRAEGCHTAAFAADATPAKVCLVCHASIDATTAPRHAAPPPWRHLPAQFSHAGHGDHAVIEARVGFRLGCTDCHAGTDEVATSPGHPACARCHADEVGIAPIMSACQGCHVDGPAQARQTRLTIGPGLRFAHRTHAADLSGAAISCGSCHAAISQQATRADAGPGVAVCVACHDDSARVPTSMRMRECATCHADDRAGIGALAPRDHLPASEQPRDHTLAFRTDHAGAAITETARCAGCHTQMSLAGRDSCDDCHQAMRPRDHNVMWRERDHGTHADADPARCAQCHTPDTCVACHAVPPRSHAPLGSFALRDHGDLARFNLRSCLTCHEPVDDCAPCHPMGSP